VNGESAIPGSTAYESEEERIEHLKQFALFKDLPDPALHYIATRVEPRPLSALLQAGRYPPPLLQPAGTTILQQGVLAKNGAGNYLYLVLEGTLRQSGMGPDGVPWLERTLKKGDMFGRYPLLTGNPPETDIEALTEVSLYRLHAAALNEIITRWPQVLDHLIPEERIRRLRGLPLFSPLPDAHIRRLADHVEEQKLTMGDLWNGSDRPEPSVWVVAEGQVALAPPDDPPPPRYEAAPPTSLTLATVGYVFLDAYVPELDIPIRQVRAVSDVTLYGLPVQKFLLLEERFFPSDGLHAFLYPTEAAEFLRAHQVFGKRTAEIPDSWWPHLVGFVAWIYTPRSQTVARQGDEEHALYVLERGEAIARVVDERGRRRPRFYLFPGHSYGDTALLVGARYDATVEATEPSFWFRLSRNDLSHFDLYIEPDRRGVLWRLVFFFPCNLWKAFRTWFRGEAFVLCWTWRSVWDRLQGIPPEGENLVHKQLGWRDPDEEIVWGGRKHRAFLGLRLILPTFLFSLSLAFLLLALIGTLPGISLTFWGLILALSGFWLLYVIVDYLNDFYAVTDRRIVHQDRIILWREQWEDVPLERVQDVIQQRNLLGRLLGYGNLKIQTAAEGGGIVMKSIPNAGHVRTIILGQRSKVRAKQRAWQQEHLRQDLQQRLFLSLLSKWPNVATGTHYPPRLFSAAARRAWKRRQSRAKKPPRPRPPLSQRRPWRWLLAFVPESVKKFIKGLLERMKEDKSTKSTATGRLVTPWVPKMHWQRNNRLYWRKHWFVLIRRVALPFLFGLLWLEVVVDVRTLLWNQVGPAVHTGFTFAAIVFFMAIFFWFLWQYDDWRNDLYVLTPDKLIDLEQRPLFLQEERREAPLDRVQNVRMEMHGPISKIFNYGNVVIQTAAAGGDIVFRRVPDPRGVARDVSRYLEDFRQRRQEKEYKQQQTMFVDNIEVYDRLVHRRSPGSGHPPEAGPF